jgi:hypothetical protein
MIVGSHVIIYSSDQAADRAFLRDVLKLPHVDVGGGWLIFGLPPSEVAIHPSDRVTSHELYLMCKDVGAFIEAMRGRALVCTPVREERWGLLTELTLPGGGKLGVYEPRHARPKQARVTTARRAQPKKSSQRARTRSRAAPRSRRGRR